MKHLDRQNLLDQLTATLITLGSPKRALAAQNDKSTNYECLAIRVPVLRKVATKDFAQKDLSPKDRLALHDYIWNQASYYEVMSIPLLFYYAEGRKRRLERFQFNTIKSWIDRVDDWGHAGGLGGILSFFNEQFKHDVFPYLQSLNRQSDLWSIRVSIVALVHYSGKNAVYLAADEAFPLLEPHIERKEKYIANAVGWVLREYRRKHPRVTEDFVENRKTKVSSIAMRRYEQA